MTAHRLRGAVLAAVLTVALSLAACRPPQKMADQPQFDPYEGTTFFADHMSARPMVPGTVARGTLPADELLQTGKSDGQDVDSFPYPVTREVLLRGQERFNIYCSMCHGRTGNGDGMIVRRGYRRPPSYHTDALRSARVGHFFDVMTNGFGAMPAYGSMIPASDRWAIAAYIRVLQYSHNATEADVPPDQQQALNHGEAGR
jgi:cytochrome c553